MKIYVIGRTSIEFSAIDSFLQEHNETWIRSRGTTPMEELIEFSGRICYMSFGKRQSPRSNRQYITNLVTQGHESVLEHISWTFLISGISRALCHQLVRHRIGFSYSQLSQQYYEEMEPEVIVPMEIRHKPRLLQIWKEAVERSKEAYTLVLDSLKHSPKSGLLSRKEFLRSVRSAARSLLPNAVSTTIVVTVNARALRHFLNVRGCIEGDYEMRRLAVGLFKEVMREAPSLFSDFKIEFLSDGSPIVKRTELGGERRSRQAVR